MDCTMLWWLCDQVYCSIWRVVLLLSAFWLLFDRWMPNVKMTQHSWNYSSLFRLFPSDDCFFRKIILLRCRRFQNFQILFEFSLTTMKITWWNFNEFRIYSRLLWNELKTGTTMNLKTRLFRIISFVQQSRTGITRNLRDLLTETWTLPSFSLSENREILLKNEKNAICEFCNSQNCQSRKIEKWRSSCGECENSN